MKSQGRHTSADHVRADISSPLGPQSLASLVQLAAIRTSLPVSPASVVLLAPTKIRRAAALAFWIPKEQVFWLEEYYEDI